MGDRERERERERERKRERKRKRERTMGVSTHVSKVCIPSVSTSVRCEVLVCKSVWVRVGKVGSQGQVRCVRYMRTCESGRVRWKCVCDLLSACVCDCDCVCARPLVCVCVCVRERERERERAQKRTLL